MGALQLRPVYRLFIYCGHGYYFPVFVVRSLAGIETIPFRQLTGCRRVLTRTTPGPKPHFGPSFC